MRHALTILLLTAVGGIALAACGSSSPGSSTSSAQFHADAIAFAKCMRSHGIPSFPDPGSNGGGLQIKASGGPGGPPQTLTVGGTPIAATTFRTAMQSCRSKLPNGGHPTAQQLAKIRAGALAMARCMRSHGVPKFPDPQFSSGPGGRFGIRLGLGTGSAGIDPNSPAFQNAIKICGKDRPGFGFRTQIGAPGGGG